MLQNNVSEKKSEGQNLNDLQYFAHFIPGSFDLLNRSKQTSIFHMMNQTLTTNSRTEV